MKEKNNLYNKYTILLKKISEDSKRIKGIEKQEIEKIVCDVDSRIKNIEECKRVANEKLDKDNLYIKSAALFLSLYKEKLSDKGFSSFYFNLYTNNYLRSLYTYKESRIISGEMKKFLKNRR